MRSFTFSHLKYSTRSAHCTLGVRLPTAVCIQRAGAHTLKFCSLTGSGLRVPTTALFYSPIKVHDFHSVSCNMSCNDGQRQRATWVRAASTSERTIRTRQHEFTVQ